MNSLIFYCFIVETGFWKFIGWSTNKWATLSSKDAKKISYFIVFSETYIVKAILLYPKVGGTVAAQSGWKFLKEATLEKLVINMFNHVLFLGAKVMYNMG